jgi:hypothetical protein
LYADDIVRWSIVLLLLRKPFCSSCIIFLVFNQVTNLLFKILQYNL